ncbi:MAG TPA: serine hydrolase domain-containing protein [Pirellulales bacterium]|nr:serine hydrolase domain-containing protein [Pirellulales bacterium]
MNRNSSYRCVSLLLSLSIGGTATAADLAPVLRPILEKHSEMPGLVGAIVDGERVTAIGAVGVRKAGAPERFRADDLIHLGSDTKAMTATLIGKLIENKKLRLETPMSEIFVKLRPQMNAEMAKVTVRQLMAHTAGLPPNVDWWKIDGTKKPLREQRLMVVEDVLTKPPRNPPGTKYEYSNVGFVVLGAIIERLHDKPWEQVIENQLFKPLGMTTAGFGPPGTPGKIDEPWGHTLKDGTPSPMQFDNAPLMGPAGRVHCSISDWAKFVSLYIQPERQRPHILAPKVMEELVTPSAGQDYAGGWSITKRSWAGGLTLTHAGSNTMWYCVAWLAPNKHFAVLVATNVAGKDPEKACDETAAALIDFHSKHGGR